MSVLWPPPYYLLRDRIPVFLSILYIYIEASRRGYVKHKISKKIEDYLGYTLIYITYACLFISVNFLIFGTDLEPIVGFRWSFPSPIEWSLFIIISCRKLMQKGYNVFESYYLCFMAGLGGGWLYEILYGIPYWIQGGFQPWNWLKFNAVKIFLVEFQVLSIPLLLYILYNNYEYKAKDSLTRVIPGVLVWHFSNFWVSPYFHRLGSWKGNTLYAWFLRVPVIIMLYIILMGLDDKVSE